MKLRTETTNDDASVIALLRGQTVLAADMGAASEPFDGPAPALVAADLLTGFAPVDAAAGRFRTTGIARPADLSFAPFFHSDRMAVLSSLIVLCSCKTKNRFAIPW